MNVERSVPPVESANKQAPKPRNWWSNTRYLLLVGAGLVALAVWVSVSRERAEVRAVAAIPAESRGQLYSRVLENLKFCRAHPNEALEHFCSTEAEFILGFPECDKECEELTRITLSHPVR